MPDSTHKSLEGGGVASEPRSRGASRAKGSEGASREANSAPGPTKAAPPSSETLLSHFETERPAGFPETTPTENVIGAESTRQPVSSSHTKPVLIDLFCGAGGCTKGYQRAGFYVIGVDLHRQPSYCGDQFVQMDALEFLRENVLSYSIRPVAIHTSPPCQRYSVLRHAAETKGKDAPDLIDPTRDLLEEIGLPYVIENVPGAPLRYSIELCGSMFGLGSGERQLRRHRLFETSFPIMQPQCQHEGEAIGVYGGGPVGRYTFGNGAKKDYYGRRGGYQGTVAEKREAMGIAWMSAKEINQAIPPAYTEFIGGYLMAEVNAPREAAA